MNSDLLARVDARIDGHTIRNRSHAIELLIKQGVQPTIDTAVIMAGGPADAQTRVLTVVNERPLISLTLEHLKRYGISNIVICAGQHNQAVSQLIGDGGQLGMTVQYVTESSPLGTAGALRMARKLISDQPFLVVHGDVLTELNITDFIQFHLEQDTIATIGVKPRMGEAKYGQAFLQGNKIVKFLQTGTDRGISIVNTGLYVLDHKIFELLPRQGFCKLETDIFPKLAEAGELSAFLFQGLWREI